MLNHGMSANGHAYKILKVDCIDQSEHRKSDIGPITNFQINNSIISIRSLKVSEQAH